MRELDVRTTDYLEFIGPLNVWRPTVISLEAIQDYTAVFGTIELNKLMMLTQYLIDEKSATILYDIFNFEFTKDGTEPTRTNDFVPRHKYLMKVTMKGQS